MKNLLNFASITLTVGILLGVFTSFGQTIIPDPFKQLANSYSVWLFFSLLAGYLVTSLRKAVVAGALLQYIAILFYYIASSVRFDMEYSLESLISLNLIWIVGGTLAGPIAGAAGALIKKKSKYVPYAVAFMTGLFVSEGLYQFIDLKYIGEGIVFSSAAIVFLAVSYYRLRLPFITTILIAILFSIIMYVGYAHILKSMFA